MSSRTERKHARVTARAKAKMLGRDHGGVAADIFAGGEMWKQRPLAELVEAMRAARHPMTLHAQRDEWARICKCPVGHEARFYRVFDAAAKDRTRQILAEHGYVDEEAYADVGDKPCWPYKPSPKALSAELCKQQDREFRALARAHGIVFRFDTDGSFYEDDEHGRIVHFLVGADVSVRGLRGQSEAELAHALGQVFPFNTWECHGGLATAIA